LALLGGARAVAPAGQVPIPNPLNQHPQSPFDAYGDMDPAVAEKQLRALNAERQKSMVSDADKLLKLAGELHAEIDAGSSASLTPAQLRKVAEIEKLAHSVKQKMSLAVGGGPVFHEPFPPRIR
ncbi:MAG: hypothetical protein WBM14_01915, partial [Terracidiphilus sp.]